MVAFFRYDFAHDQLVWNGYQQERLKRGKSLMIPGIFKNVNIFIKQG
jgi:hypothetical protein